MLKHLQQWFGIFFFLSKGFLYILRAVFFNLNCSRGLWILPSSFNLKGGTYFLVDEWLLETLQE